MNFTRTALTRFIVVLAIGALCFACSPSPEPEPPPAAPIATEEATPEATEEATPAADEVAFEPAYPEDVSTEELTEADVAQQDADPGGEHSHGDDADHTHDDGNDDHQH